MLKGAVDPAGGAAMTPAARPRAEAGRALAPRRNQFRFGRLLPGWLAACCRDLAASRALYHRDHANGWRRRGWERVSERITHTRLDRWPLTLPGGEHVIVEARRRPVTGDLLWLVHLDGICWDIRRRHRAGR
jgi:hypothetical protein